MTTPASDASAAPPTRANARIWGFGLLAVIVLAGGFLAGAIPKWRQQQHNLAAAKELASTPPRVVIVAADRAPANTERVLPGNSLPLMEAALYARTTGFLKRRLVDIGDRVAQGQLLAEISAPDIDDQLAQAQANVEQSRATLKLNQANAALANTILARYQGIKTENAGAISQQLIDEQIATARTSAASVENALASIKVNEAQVQRFTDLQSFQQITAPFAGVITARNVDAGDLISADSPNASTELFHLMRTDVLRVFVNVPQAFATEIAVGQQAAVFLATDPTKLFAGQVARTAVALDPNTRTLLTEVDVPNPNNDLRPGMYLQVKFRFDRSVYTLMIPSAALVTRNGAARVAVLDSANQVRYRKVQLGRDYGAQLEVLAGLEAGERIVVHPGDDLPAGTLVEPVLLPN